MNCKIEINVNINVYLNKKEGLSSDVSKHFILSQFLRSKKRYNKKSWVRIQNSLCAETVNGLQ